MRYLTIEDLNTDSFQKFITESTKDFEESIDKAELRAIGIAKPFLRNADYDIMAIFDEDFPLRNEMLVDILVKITLKLIFGRNAARKVPEDVRTDYNDAIKWLEKISTSKITLEFMTPDEEEDDGKDGDDKLFYGNLKNSNYYI